MALQEPYVGNCFIDRNVSRAADQVSILSSKIKTILLLLLERVGLSAMVHPRSHPFFGKPICFFSFLEHTPPNRRCMSKETHRQSQNLPPWVILLLAFCLLLSHPTTIGCNGMTALEVGDRICLFFFFNFCLAYKIPIPPDFWGGYIQSPIPTYPLPSYSMQMCPAYYGEKMK